MFNHIESMRMATRVAVVAHRNQLRKNGTTPYIVHPANVAQLVTFYDPANYNGVIIAWMHDVLEDCGREGNELFWEFMHTASMRPEDLIIVHDSVGALTKNDNLHPREAKWDDCLARLFDPETPRVALLVKFCDRMDNLMDMDSFTTGFKRIYQRETDQFINMVDHYPLSAPERSAFDDLVKVRDEVFRNI